MLKLAIGAVVLYCGFVALLYVAQRRLQYFPERWRTVPRAVGLPEAEEAVVDTADGERVIVWHVAPREEQPVFLYFHGNGGSLRWRDERFHALIADGSGLVALSYRGYGGSSGRPTETGLLADAAAAYGGRESHKIVEIGALRFVFRASQHSHESIFQSDGRASVIRYAPRHRLTQRGTRVIGDLLRQASETLPGPA
jgi:hypothetical protein